MILLIDNYDSFVHNLARHFAMQGRETLIMRNDALSVEEIADMAPGAIILSPGPCAPDTAGICIDVIKHWGAHIPLLGVCLGHQAIGMAFGCPVTKISPPLHGKASAIHHNGNGLFEGLPDPLTGGRYHSLIIGEPGAGTMLEVTARDERGTIMAVQHRADPIYGVQFHPESVLTAHGETLITNFLHAADRFNKRKTAA